MLPVTVAPGAPTRPSDSGAENSDGAAGAAGQVTLNTEAAWSVPADCVGSHETVPFCTATPGVQVRLTEPELLGANGLPVTVAPKPAEGVQTSAVDVPAVPAPAVTAMEAVPAAE